MISTTSTAEELLIESRQAMRGEHAGRISKHLDYKAHYAQNAPGQMNGRAAPARPGEIAIREEYELLKGKGSVEALQLFIDRHPDHPLANEARETIRDHLIRQKDEGK